MAASNRAPRNAKPLIGKVMQLIQEFPLQSQVEVAQYLSGQLRTEIVPDLRTAMKAAAKEATGTRSRSTTRGTAARGGNRSMSTAKRKEAGKKAAATRKARGTQRGGRRARNTTTQTHEIQADTQTANSAAA